MAAILMAPTPFIASVICCVGKRIIHTDIKPDNLLMSLDKKSVKLSDFGCAFDCKKFCYVLQVLQACLETSGDEP